MPIIAHKSNFHLDTPKKPNIISEGWAFNCRGYLNIDLHMCNHSPILISTRPMFDYQVMFSEGHVYPASSTNSEVLPSKLLTIERKGNYLIWSWDVEVVIEIQECQKKLSTCLECWC